MKGFFWGGRKYNEQNIFLSFHLKGFLPHSITASFYILYINRFSGKDQQKSRTLLL
jgi:hypothetical protein